MLAKASFTAYIIHMQLSLTPAAAKRLDHLRAKQDKKSLYLRVTVDGGGCQGFEYKFSFTDQPDADDLFVEANDEPVGVVTDPTRLESTIPALSYCSSKSALTMLTLQYAKALPELRINVVDPGYTATDLNHHSGPQTVEQGTDAIVKLATIGKDGPTGTFHDRAGPLPW